MILLSTSSYLQVLIYKLSSTHAIRSLENVVFTLHSPAMPSSCALPTTVTPHPQIRSPPTLTHAHPQCFQLLLPIPVPPSCTPTDHFKDGIERYTKSNGKGRASKTNSGNGKKAAKNGKKRTTRFPFLPMFYKERLVAKRGRVKSVPTVTIQRTLLTFTDRGKYSSGTSATKTRDIKLS